MKLNRQKGKKSMNDKNQHSESVIFIGEEEKYLKIKLKTWNYFKVL